MTTPEPRVRVEYDAGEALFYWRCGHCRKESGRGRLFISGAARDAHRHAATCPALRLRLLIRELEALRDCYSDAYAETEHERSTSFRTGLRAAWLNIVNDLTAIIDRAGGTG